MIRRLLFATLFVLSVWTIGAGAQSCPPPSPQDVSEHADTSCGVSAPDSTSRWDTPSLAPSLNLSVWRTQPDRAEVPAFAVVPHRSTAAVHFVAERPSASVVPHLHDIPLLI